MHEKHGLHPSQKFYVFLNFAMGRGQINFMKSLFMDTDLTVQVKLFRLKVPSSRRALMISLPSDRFSRHDSDL